MSMFDYIKCEYPLPTHLEGASLFQTKSFHNLMEEYRISQDGFLYHTKISYEFVEEQNRPYFGTGEWQSNLLYKIIGALKDVKQPEEKIYYSGRVQFYWYDSSNKILHDYVAIFLDGKLLDITYILKTF